MEVAVLRWPEHAEERARLEARGLPRLLLLGPGVEPPEVPGCLEDWVRLPTTDADVEARKRGLLVRSRAHVRLVPELDDHGVLRYGSRWVALPPVEARMASALVPRFGAVVGRDTLRRSAWPGSSPARNVLDVHVLRLRRRLAPLGLAIRTVRSRGYMLESSESGEPGRLETRQAATAATP